LRERVTYRAGQTEVPDATPFDVRDHEATSPTKGTSVPSALHTRVFSNRTGPRVPRRLHAARVARRRGLREVYVPSLGGGRVDIPGGARSLFGMLRLPLAEALRVKTPCTKGWDTMQKDGSPTRFCTSCAQHVHDVAKLTHAEASALVEAKARGESVCVHLRVRSTDGAILLADGHAFPSTSVRRLGPSFVAAGAMVLVACAETVPPVPELVPVRAARPTEAPYVPAPVGTLPTSEAPPATPDEPPPSSTTAAAPVVPNAKSSKGSKSKGPTVPPIYVDVDGGI